MTSPKLPRKTTRELALETCRATMTLHSELTRAIADAESLMRNLGTSDDQAINAHLDFARQAATSQFTTAIAMDGCQPPGTGKDLQCWKNLSARLKKATDRVAQAVLLLLEATTR